MKRLFLSLTSVLLASVLSSELATSQTVTLVVDKTTAMQATQNGIAATASEALIAGEFEKVREEQSRVQRMIGVVEAHLAKVEKTQKDISAFRKEGAAIKLFLFKTKTAVGCLKDLTNDIQRAPKGVLASAKLISTLSQDIYGMGKDMVCTVIDARYDLPGIKVPINQKNKTNLLEPQERLAFYERCNYEMDIIIFKIKQMRLSIMTENSLQSIVQNIAHSSYVTVEYGKYVAQDIVDLWRQ